MEALEQRGCVTSCSDIRLWQGCAAAMASWAPSLSLQPWGSQNRGLPKSGAPSSAPLGGCSCTELISSACSQHPNHRAKGERGTGVSPGDARKVLQGGREVDTAMGTILRGPSHLLSHRSDQGLAPAMLLPSLPRGDFVWHKQNKE